MELIWKIFPSLSHGVYNDLRAHEQYNQQMAQIPETNAALENEIGNRREAARQVEVPPKSMVGG